MGAWVLRWLAFKLLFMSGVVKVHSLRNPNPFPQSQWSLASQIQANCPTWISLTALEYHFATQVLTPPPSPVLGA
jgi:hypothetical protein